MRQARLEAGLKQEALAESIGVAPLSVSHIENGRQAPKVETLERIAEATHRPLAWFFQEDAAPAPLDRPAAEETLRELQAAQERMAAAQEPAAAAAAPEPLEVSRGAPLEPDLDPGLLDSRHLSALITQAIAAATSPLVAELRCIRSELHTKLDAQATKLDAQATKLNHQAAELHHLRQEVREQHRAQNRLNDAKYTSPMRPQRASPSADAGTER